MSGANEPGDFDPAFDLGVTAEPTSAPSEERFAQTMVGRYRLLEKIGEGGFGVVYVAEQRTPVRRRVALKIIKPGMDSRQVVARFEAERQALAMMDHANIAQVFDGGTTKTGSPYFVMELVAGVPITEYCDQNNLPPVERLHLFMQVCQAIGYAHQKGIIHRDIKPSNVLVTLHDGTPVPKVIDFGIAKATLGALTEKTVYTQFQQFIGTPAYISPEQAQLSALDVDTRSDIYSLGVLLYELLTGQTPFDAKELAQAGLDEMRRRIREVDPVSPSTRLSGMVGSDWTAKRRGMELAKLITFLRGDLDWIVMRCLEKDRSRRYETANALALDVQRYLHDEAIVARPPSKAYRFRKLVRRNRLAFGAAAVVAAVLVAGICISTTEAIRASRAMDLAQAAERTQAKLAAAALAAQASEAVQRQHAEMALVEAERQRAEGLVAQGDALTQAKRWPEARERMEESYDAFLSAKLDPVKAVFALSDFDSISPPCLLSFRGHRDCVTSVDFSPGGQTALSASYDGTLRLWDVASGREIRRMDAGADDQLERAVFSPDGRMALSGGKAMVMKLWDLADGRLVRSFSGHSGIIWSMKFSADGRSVLSAALDNTVKLWDVDSGREIRTFVGHTAPVFCCDFSPDGRTAASGGQDGTVQFWDLASGRQIGQCTGRENVPVFSLVYTADGRSILTGAWDWSITLWDVASGKATRNFAGHLASVNWVALSRDGKRVVSGSSDRMVKLWDFKSGRELVSYSGHGDVIRSVAISPDRQTILSGSFDGTVKSWDMRPAQELRSFGGGEDTVYSVAFCRDGRTALSGMQQMRLWDVATGHELRRFPDAQTNLYSIAVSPDGQSALTENSGNRITLWDLTSGQEIRSFSGHTRKVQYATFSPDGRTILSASADRTIKLWDAATGELLRTFTGHTARVGCVEFSPDGKTALSASDDGTVRLWDIASGQCLRTFVAGSWVAMRMAFSPDGRLAISSDYDRNSVLMWDIASGRLVHDLPGHLAYIWGMAFSPDGRMLYTVDQNGILKTWDAHSGQEIHSFYRYEPRSNSVAGGGFADANAWCMSLRGDGQALLIGTDGLLLRDFGRIATYHDFGPRLAAAQRALAAHADDVTALAVLGEWWAFRHENQWAVECLEKARAGGAAVEPLELGRCYWNLNRLVEARREYGAALDRSSTPQERTYLQWCIAAIDRSPSTQPTTAPAEN